MAIKGTLKGNFTKSWIKISQKDDSIIYLTLIFIYDL